MYDSREDTLKHIDIVSENIIKIGKALEAGSPTKNAMIISKELADRSVYHDHSKLEDPELSVFNRVTPKLKALTYGSDEYKASLKEMGTALDHHYEHNRHHPEHYKYGIRDMNLVDVVEMFCDWKAACQRHADGDITKSININKERFGYDDELTSIFHSTETWFHFPVHLEFATAKEMCLVDLLIEVCNDGAFHRLPMGPLLSKIVNNTINEYKLTTAPKMIRHLDLNISNFIKDGKLEPRTIKVTEDFINCKLRDASNGMLTPGPSRTSVQVMEIKTPRCKISPESTIEDMSNTINDLISKTVDATLGKGPFGFVPTIELNDGMLCVAISIYKQSRSS